MNKYTCPLCDHVETGENEPNFCPKCACPGKKFDCVELPPPPPPPPPPPEPEPAAAPPEQQPQPAETAAPTPAAEKSPDNIPFAGATAATPHAAPEQAFVADCTEAGMFLIVSRAAANAGFPEFASAMSRIAVEKATLAARPVEELLRKHL